MKYIILGAGPAGLTLANKLLDRGEKSFIILEKEKCPGGLCRSEDMDGSPYDIGGGHFLDVRNKEVVEYLFRFMPENEWNIFDRVSKISLEDGTVVDHPIEANIWQMPSDKQQQYLDSISKAGCNLGEEKPEKFRDWIKWKLGDKIAEEYMIPYNIKMFGEELDQLGTYWLEKLPDVSYEETLRSCQEHKAYGKQPGHAKFYYPKNNGYGEVWNRMAERVKENIIYEQEVSELNIEKKSVTTKNKKYYCTEKIITTIPWMSFKIKGNIPDYIKKTIGKLKFSSIQTQYYPNMLSTNAHWIYFPALNLSYHRILVRHNFLPGSRGYWTETNGNRVKEENENTYWNEYAYPLNTIGKEKEMPVLLEFMRKYGVWGLGRWGEHSHFNSDVVVEKAMKMAEII